MWESEIKWKLFNDSLRPSDKICAHCKYYFGGQDICVNDGSPVGYGGKVSDEFSCDEWEAELLFFDGRLKEIERKKTVF